MQRNPYWPPKGPSFFSVLRFRGCVLSPCTKGGVGFGPNFAARRASRRGPNLVRLRGRFPNFSPPARPKHVEGVC